LGSHPPPQSRSARAQVVCLAMSGTITIDVIKRKKADVGGPAAGTLATRQPPAIVSEDFHSEVKRVVRH
jgi:hypothetical protein